MAKTPLRATNQSVLQSHVLLLQSKTKRHHSYNNIIIKIYHNIIIIYNTNTSSAVNRIPNRAYSQKNREEKRERKYEYEFLEKRDITVARF